MQLEPRCAIIVGQIWLRDDVAEGFTDDSDLPRRRLTGEKLRPFRVCAAVLSFLMNRLSLCH